MVVNDVGDAAHEVCEAINQEGGSAMACVADISDPAGAAEVIKSAIDDFGGLHIVVSNAGIINSAAFSDMDYAAFDRVMKVNAYGSFNVINAAWPHLLRQQYGRVVMVSSSSAWTQQPLISHYAASKGAILGLAMSLAAEGADNGITVNVVAPGAFTAMASAVGDETARRQMETMMSPSLVSPAVAWLALESNRHNGQIFEVAAGRVARNFVGSTRGYWNRNLTVDDLLQHEDSVLDTEGFAVIEDTVQLARWMTESNTGWE
ncbi:SDR family NAD(P)-dependent oxidoreductase, partial [Rhodococcus sp. T7]|uniref:SDR family NAD(P)-dependent oxidoreductase n=1 Tax=Rhodococcus sp. T7 TaxID=627444 RepID=UPI001F2C8C8A